MKAPRLLDLFCGAGGASMGYARAGFDVHGIDINPQPNYPFAFTQADAVEISATFVRGFDVVHASPPCQRYSGPKSVNGNRGHPDLLPVIRQLLTDRERDFVLENVAQAPLRKDLILCGEMFSLPVLRHRIFESTLPLEQPEHLPHRGRVRGWRHGVYYDGPYLAVYGKGGGKASFTEARVALGVPWMQTYDEVREAIPPAYTEFIGRQLLSVTATR